MFDIMLSGKAGLMSIGPWLVILYDDFAFRFMCTVAGASLRDVHELIQQISPYYAPGNLSRSL